MKTWSMVAAMLVMAFCASAVLAEGPEHHNQKAGQITKIDGSNITIQPKGMGDAKPAEVTFAVTDATKVKIGGEAKTVSDLKVGQRISVNLSEDGKTAIAINSGRKEGGDKKKG